MAARKPAAKPAKPAAKPAAAKGGDIDAQFAAASAQAKQLKERPDNDTLLRLYALYKQGAEGDVSGARPGMFDMRGRAKWDAWDKRKGMSTDEAMDAYIAYVAQLG